MNIYILNINVEGYKNTVYIHMRIIITKIYIVLYDICMYKFCIKTALQLHHQNCGSILLYNPPICSKQYTTVFLSF